MFHTVLTRFRPRPVAQTVCLPAHVRLRAEGLCKGVARNQQGLPLIQNFTLTATAGECIGLTSAGISTKSVLLQLLSGQSSTDAGSLWVLDREKNRWVDLMALERSQRYAVRHNAIGYLGQFLPVNSKATTFETVLEPLLERRIPLWQARETVSRTLRLLDIPSRLWRISPLLLPRADRRLINLARVFAVDYPVFVLNMPMAEMGDRPAVTRAALIELIQGHKAKGSAIIGLFQDPQLQASVCTRTVNC